MNHENTIREALALLRGGHIADAIACLAVVVNSLPPVQVERPCDTDDGDDMCGNCRCWKHTRALCS